MGNPFQVKLSQMLRAANTDLPGWKLCFISAAAMPHYAVRILRNLAISGVSSTSNRPGRIRWPRQRGRKFTDFHSL